MKLKIISLLVITAFSNTTFAATEFQECLSRLKKEASSEGVNKTTFDTYTKNLEPNMKLLENLESQPEFKTPIWDYMASLVDDLRIEEGKSLLAKNEDTLKQVYEQYGVDPATVIAVWGVESNYGRNFGKQSLVQSLGTLACFGRRQNYFKSEWFSSLRILQEGSIKPDELRGSWAGAFGHTQFMPSTFEKTAVDFDGDGRRDLINSIPDALASTANYLKKAGWKDGIPWGYEVKVPEGFDFNGHGRRYKYSIEEWAEKGVRKVDGTPLPQGKYSAGLLSISGPKGPLFLVTTNFDAIYRYNAAESYALAIAHLSERMKGGSPFVTPWPTDDGPLSRQERIELQTILVAKGYEIGELKGDIGPKTRFAIKKEQEKLGWEVTGRAGQKLLKELKNTSY